MEAEGGAVISELDSPYVGKSTQIQEETWFSTVEHDMVLNLWTGPRQNGAETG
jgi:hypothetical protein